MFSSQLCQGKRLGKICTKSDQNEKSRLLGFIPSWWLNQPISKICSSNWIISPYIYEHRTYLKPPPGFSFEHDFLIHVLRLFQHTLDHKIAICLNTVDSLALVQIPYSWISTATLECPTWLQKCNKTSIWPKENYPFISFYLHLEINKTQQNRTHKSRVFSKKLWCSRIIQSYSIRGPKPWSSAVKAFYLSIAISGPHGIPGMILRVHQFSSICPGSIFLALSYRGNNLRGIRTPVGVRRLGTKRASTPPRNEPVLPHKMGDEPLGNRSLSGASC